MAQTYKVKSGDNWVNIAAKYGVQFQNLVRANSGVTQPRAGTYITVPDTVKAASQAGVIGNPYAQQWLNKKNAPVGMGGYQGKTTPQPPKAVAPKAAQPLLNQLYANNPTIAPKPLLQNPLQNVRSVQQYQRPVTPQAQAGVVGNPYAQQWLNNQQRVQSPAITGAPQQFQNGPVVYDKLGSGAPTRWGYTYGGYNPVTQEVTYVDNRTLGWQSYGPNSRFSRMIASGIAPTTLSLADQFNMGYTDQDMKNAGYLKRPNGYWLYSRGGGWDEPDPQPGGNAPGGGGIGYQYQQPDYSRRGRTGTGGTAGRSRGITGYDRTYTGAIGPISWRI